MSKIYSYEEAIKSSLEYFNNDDLAADVFVSKYALRNENGDLVEKNPDQMHRRLSKEFSRIESKYPNPLSEEDIYNLFKSFKYVVPQGSPMSAIGNNHQVQSASNCFVIPSPEDSYGGILLADQQQAQIMKRRGGVGFDVSKIRPKGIKTSNAAKTTDGIGVFLERFSNTTREVAQGGRRGALMLTIDIRHPEIETFIKIKQDKSKVTGANISIRLTDDFMKAVKEDSDFDLFWPLDSKKPTIKGTIKARLLWNKIIHAAWSSAEPGLLFWDTSKRYTPSDIYKDFGYESISTNPCTRHDTIIKTLEFGDITIKQASEFDYEGSKRISVWNGFEYSPVVVKVTGYNQSMSKVTLSNGKYLVCTKYHNWVIDTKSTFYEEAYPDHILLQTKQLNIGDKVKFYDDEKQPYIISIEEAGVDEKVYCFNEPKRHLGMFNGIITGQCSEIILSAFDSCRLMAINLYSFVNNRFTSKAEFDYNKFSEVVIKTQRLMDDLVDIEIEQVDKILDKIKNDPETENAKRVELELWQNIRKACINGRRTGLGITALGDTIASLNVRYGSKKSIEITEQIYKTLAISSYKSSCILAGERGTFPIFNHKLEKNHPFIERILDASQEVKDLYNKYGRRNIANTTTAPTGSVSCVTQTTSGIEPAFLLKYDRFRKINPNDKEAIPDRIDQMGDKWQKYTVYHHAFKHWMDVTGNKEVEDSPYHKATSNDIDWISSVELQSVAQKWICHAISKTCNLPKDATEETVSKVYMKAWESGCKGFTVYRDGCRDGVLVATDEKKEKTLTIEKRPKELISDVYHISVKGEKYFVFIGLLNGKPYEVFAGKNGFIDKVVKSATVIKLSRGCYRADLDDSKTIDNITEYIDEDQEALTRLISLSLRHGNDLSFVTHQLEKIKGDMTSLAKAISRCLKKYIKDGTEINGESCQSCGKDSLIRKEGCSFCTNCGSSKCG